VSGSNHDASIRNGTPSELRTPAYAGQHEGQLTTGRIESSAPGITARLAAFPDGEGGEGRSAAMIASRGGTPRTSLPT
jgi:hypothetical protein